MATQESLDKIMGMIREGGSVKGEAYRGKAYLWPTLRRKWAEKFGYSDAPGGAPGLITIAMLIDLIGLNGRDYQHDGFGDFGNTNATLFNQIEDLLASMQNALNREEERKRLDHKFDALEYLTGHRKPPPYEKVVIAGPQGGRVSGEFEKRLAAEKKRTADEMKRIIANRMKDEWEKWHQESSPGVKPTEAPPPAIVAGPICQCGGEKSKAPHSTWCPKYER